MRKAVIALASLAAAGPLAFLNAAPASADPGDITAVFTTTPNPGSPGTNTVTGTFTPTGDNDPYMCMFFDRSDDPFILEATSSGFREDTKTASDFDVPDGTYTVAWLCYVVDAADKITVDGTVRGGTVNGEELGPEYQQPTTLVVPAPPTPEPGCTGSVCLPPGISSGF